MILWYYCKLLVILSGVEGPRDPISTRHGPGTTFHGVPRLRFAPLGMTELLI